MSNFHYLGIVWVLCLHGIKIDLEEIYITFFLEVERRWFKKIWKEEKDLHNFIARHFSKFPSLLRENVEAR